MLLNSGLLVIVPTEADPPTVVISAATVPQPVPVPVVLHVKIVCITLGTMVAFVPAPATVSVTFAGLASATPLLVQSAPVIEPEPTRLKVTVAAVMPVERLGSNGDGTITPLGATA